MNGRRTQPGPGITPGGLAEGRGGGWGEPAPLADDFWRVAHDDATGRRHGDLGVVSLGLGAALLGELWLAGAVHLDRGVLQVIPGGLRGPDLLGHRTR